MNIFLNKNLIKTSQRYFFSVDLKKAQEYAIQKVRDRAWSTYIITSHLPKQLRNAFCAIHLFNMQLIKISDNMRQPSLAAGRMQFWSGIIDKIYNFEEIAQEPISICLQDACKNNPLTKGYFLRMIQGRSQQIAQRNVETMQDLIRLAEKTHGPILALMLQLLRIQIENPETQKLITYLSQSIGISHYLKRVPYGLRNYRFFLPMNIMSKYNLYPRNVWDRVHGKPSQQLFDVALEVAAYAKQNFDLAKQLFQQNHNKLHKEIFRAFLQGVQNQLFLQNLEKCNFNLFDKSLHKSSPIQYPYRLLSAARNRKFYV